MIVPPIQTIINDSYTAIATEIRAIRNSDERMSSAEARTLAGLARALSDFHKVETENLKRERFEDLTDAQLDDEIIKELKQNAESS